MASIKEYILESPIGYALWSAPLNRPKTIAIRGILDKHKKPRGSILDVGCGPGSNADVFADDTYNYVGVDFNPQYIESASKLYPKKTFRVGDATKLDLNGQLFDIILVNSLMHHLDDSECEKLLSDLRPLLKEDGLIITQEPLIPQKGKFFMTLMMNQDRGDYFRFLDDWKKLYVSAGYQITDEDFYDMKLIGITGWKMFSATLSKN